jgi:hypothetical protein
MSWIMRKTREAKNRVGGCIVILLGLLLAPVLIGIFIIIYGIGLMNECNDYWVCDPCCLKFPR